MSPTQPRPTSLPVGQAAPTPPRPASPVISTPQSAIISVPPEWSTGESPTGGSSRARIDDVYQEMPWTTASRSDASPNPNDFHDRRDPFDNTTSFAEDPFAQPVSGSSSSGGNSRQGSFGEDMDAIGDRRGSVVMIPHQFRSVTDPLLNDGQPVDAEITGAGPAIEGYNFDATSAQPYPGHPTFVRTFSAPLPDRIRNLRHPLSPTMDPLGSYSAHPPSFSAFSPTTARPKPASDHTDSSLTAVSDASTPSEEIVTPIQTLSVELADSLQSAIQTLLHLSPPHLLDNAKEQYSGCTVQMPATSLTALLTSMRSLNYLSANVGALVGVGPKDEGLLAGGRPTEDFDIGELLQSVADLLSGQAAQAGVDFVLFHGDVGIKHVSVKGDGEGLAYVLSHVIRQILLVASKGDTIELGLQIIPQSPSMTPRVAFPLSAADVAQYRHPRGSSARSSSPGQTLPSPSSDGDGPVLCIFEIVHNINQLPDSAATTPRAEINPFTRLAEEKESMTPKLDSLLCRRMLQQQNASLKLDAQPSSPLGNGLPRRAYEFTVLLPRGKPFQEPPHLSAEEEAVRQPFLTMRLAREPTLSELHDFAESLRGRKVFLHANLTSLFARHLTSYLAAWGLDISHIPIEEIEEPDRLSAKSAMGRHDSGYGGSVGSTPGNELVAGLAAMSLAPSGRDLDRFIIIDDDVVVLRRELIRIRAEANPLSLRPRMAKRPTLASRARSTPHVRQVSSGRQLGPVLIHFTSLGNYNQVRDVVSNFLGSPWSTGAGAYIHPEVMVIPKPVGPRRFLTALHTAVNQPLVDPFFSPIANSPRSPGGGYFAGARTPTGQMEGGFFDTVTEETLEAVSRKVSDSSSQKARSPLGEFPPAAASIVRTETGLHLSLPTPGDILATPASEYFSNTKTESSGASGVIMQSPDGRAFGMFFEPPAKSDGRKPSYTQRVPTDSIRRRAGNRRPSGAMDDSLGSPSSSRSNRRFSTTSAASGATEDDVATSRRGSTRSIAGIPGDLPALNRRSSRRKTLPASDSEPIIAVGRDRSATLTQRSHRNTPGSSPIIGSPRNKAEEEEALPPSFHPPRPGKKAAVLELDDMHRLPAQATLAELLRAKKAGKEDVVVPPINVLIVEDNPINQNILSMFLRKKKIKHQSAKDGLEAVDKWRTGGFHLILMDIQLPVMDGIEATKEIRKLERSNNIGILPSTPISEHPRPPPSQNLVPSSPFRSSVIIVALTASSLQSDRVVALAAGCNDFLTKPVSLKWLEKKIVEWGCMQALIDFDGWRRWKGTDPKDSGEMKRGFSVGPQAAARNLASRLRIERGSKGTPATARATGTNPSSPEIKVRAATPEATAPQSQINPLDQAAASLDVARSELVENKLSAMGTTQMDLDPSVTAPSASKVLSAINEDSESPLNRIAALPAPEINPNS